MVPTTSTTNHDDSTIDQAGLVRREGWGEPPLLANSKHTSKSRHSKGPGGQTWFSKLLSPSVVGYSPISGLVHENPESGTIAYVEPRHAGIRLFDLCLEPLPRCTSFSSLSPTTQRNVVCK